MGQRNEIDDLMCARDINRICERRSPLFERRFSAEPVLDDAALCDLAMSPEELKRRIPERFKVALIVQDILRVLTRRGVVVDESGRRRIMECQDLNTLPDWLDNAVTASQLSDVFA